MFRIPNNRNSFPKDNFSLNNKSSLRNIFRSRSPRSKSAQFNGLSHPDEEMGYPSNPEIVGPGMWFTMHLTAYFADDPKKIDDYISFLRMMIKNHKCGTCRRHGTRYLEIDPPENYVDMVNEDGRLTGMFFHSWKFHNNVNHRLGKPLVDFKTAWNMFHTDEGFCPIGCGQNNSESGGSESSTSKFQKSLQWEPSPVTEINKYSHELPPQSSHKGKYSLRHGSLSDTDSYRTSSNENYQPIGNITLVDRSNTPRQIRRDY